MPPLTEGLGSATGNGDYGGAMIFVEGCWVGDEDDKDGKKWGRRKEKGADDEEDEKENFHFISLMTLTLH